MNGGVHHAVDSLSDGELEAAVAGYGYFGLGNVASLLQEVAADLAHHEWTDAAEDRANARYNEMVPDDRYLYGRLQAAIRDDPSPFAPTDEG